MNIIGDVKGKDAIIVDDMIDTAGTLTHAAKAVMDAGARTRLGLRTPRRALAARRSSASTTSPLAERDRHRHDPAAARTAKACAKVKQLSVGAPARRGDQAHPSRRFDQLAVHLTSNVEKGRRIMEVGKLNVEFAATPASRPSAGCAHAGKIPASATAQAASRCRSRSTEGAAARRSTRQEDATPCSTLTRRPARPTATQS